MKATPMRFLTSIPKRRIKANDWNKPWIWKNIFPCATNTNRLSRLTWDVKIEGNQNQRLRIKIK